MLSDSGEGPALRVPALGLFVVGALLRLVSMITLFDGTIFTFTAGEGDKKSQKKCRPTR